MLVMFVGILPSRYASSRKTGNAPYCAFWFVVLRKPLKMYFPPVWVPTKVEIPVSAPKVM